MLVSMTGFGSGRYESDQLRVAVEVRSVNHRYLEMTVRLPKGYALLEEKIRAWVAQRVRRGRLEISVVIEDFGLRGRTVTLDSHLLASYGAALAKAREIVPVTGELTVAALLSVPELFQIAESPVDPVSIWPQVAEALEQAFASVLAMRAAEGERLQADLLARLDAFAGYVAAIADRAPQVVEAYRERLQRRVAALGSDLALDAARLEAEVALMAERCAIDEEIVRLRSHIEAFRAACAEEGGVGKKLDFLLQEMHREVNTIGAKASDGEIARLVVEAKAELEKMREQVQNVE